jgi:hypothetical protein
MRIEQIKTASTRHRRYLKLPLPPPEEAAAASFGLAVSIFSISSISSVLVGEGGSVGDTEAAAKEEDAMLLL